MEVEAENCIATTEHALKTWNKYKANIRTVLYHHIKVESVKQIEWCQNKYASLRTEQWLFWAYEL